MIISKSKYKLNDFSRGFRQSTGFSTVGILILLPMLLVIAFSLVGMGITLKVESQAQQECRMTLLSMQSQVEHELQNLLHINSFAKHSRQAQTVLKWAKGLAAALMQPEIVVLLNRLQKGIRMFQKFLVFKQKFHLQKAKLILMGTPQLLRMKIAKIFHDNAFYYAQNRWPLYFIKVKKPGRLRVVAKNKKSDSPDYLPQTNFERGMTTEIRWWFRINDFLPLGFAKLIRSSNYKINSGCAATLIETTPASSNQQPNKDRQWTAQLKMVK